MTESQAADPVLKVSVASKKTIALNEQVEIGCRLENVGAVPVSVLARPFAYPTLYFVMRDGPDGNKMPTVHKSEVNPAFPLKDSFVELGPGESHVISFPAISAEETLTDIWKESPAVKGLYLDFGVSAILLNRAETYFVQCVFGGFEDDRRLAVQYGIHNVWVGRVVSDPVRLDVRKR